MHLFAVTSLAVLLAAPGAAASDAAHPAPRFTRADRREKLASAFPEIEALPRGADGVGPRSRASPSAS